MIPPPHTFDNDLNDWRSSFKIKVQQIDTVDTARTRSDCSYFVPAESAAAVAVTATRPGRAKPAFEVRERAAAGLSASW